MEVVSKALEGNQISVTFIGTKEELQAEFLTAAELLDAADDSIEAGVAAGGGGDHEFHTLRKAYCCTCDDGHHSTKQASHSRSAFFKCLGECGLGFSMRPGTCE